MARKLIVCCDGTGNEIEQYESNVLRFYRCLKKDGNQVVFYDPGVGTVGSENAWARFLNHASSLFGLATGFGIDKKVLTAYRFLSEHYTFADARAGDAVDTETGEAPLERDEIYLFGYSRGAYTVRVLAGLLNSVGLLHPQSLNLLPYALAAYKRSSRDGGFEDVWRIQHSVEAHPVRIRLIGCWDTVSSIIVPRLGRWPFLSLQTLPHTRSNSCVEAFRHAMAIDERRRMFRLNRWKDQQKAKRHPYQAREDAADQDVRQVWFAGFHSDVGGGQCEENSGAAKYPLTWMIDEARALGLAFRERRVLQLALGRSPTNVKPRSAPRPNALLHDSMNLAWRVLEWLPKLSRWKEWPKRRSFLGLYIPREEPRLIDEGSVLHASVIARRNAGGASPYTPPNLPATFDVEKWPHG